MSSSTTSTLIMFAILAFFEGHRVITYNSKGKAVQHIQYNSSILCQQFPNPNYGRTPDEPRFLRDSFPAQLRLWSPSRNDTIHVDGTAAIVIAKVHFPAPLADNDTLVLLDAIEVFPFKGDPSHPDYESHIPDFIVPFFFTIGTVQNAAEKVDGDARGFFILTHEYVRDSMKESRVQ